MRKQQIIILGIVFGISLLGLVILQLFPDGLRCEKGAILFHRESGYG